MIESTRVNIYPATKIQMEDLISAESDAELKSAYKEMLDGCLKNPNQWEWYAIWMIELKDGTHIGDLCFKGLDPKGIAEIGYGISKEYQNNGYATEAVKAVLGWAFDNPNVISVEAETDSGNEPSKKVLEKCGFTLNGEMGEEGPRYTISHC